MKGAEYQRAIDRLGMTQVESAEFFGVNATTPRRWIADTSPIPRSVSMVLRLMLRYRLTTDFVLRLLQRARTP